MLKKAVWLFFVVLLIPFVIGNSDPSVTLSRPSDGEVVNNPVTFTWRYFDPEGDLLRYSIIQIDEDFVFNSPMNYLVEGDSFRIRLQKRGEYFWRVQVVNQFGSKISKSNRFFLNTEEKVCSDGTQYFECSVNKPLYCDNGILIDKCQKCGCNVDGNCQLGGNCLVRKCADGTLYGSCAGDKPNYCFQGVIKEVCSLCGCPDGLECVNDGGCMVKEKTPEQEILKIPEKKFSSWERVVNFFSWLFLGSPLYK